MSNIATTRANTLNRVLDELGNREEMILGMLPPDLPLERFRANVTNALRSNAKLLDCEPNSLVQACMKAAYDGLRIDGREAVIVEYETTFNKGKPGERKVKLAQYMPMAFGLIQQVYRGGEVASMYAEVIREGDEYHVQRGTNPGIHHVPSMKGGGKILAAYSVATLKSGATTFEFLTRFDLDDIRKAAQTDKVWNRWEGEMSKKSAVRRHRKTLPLGDRDIVIRDAEAEELYPEMRAPGIGHNQPPGFQPMPTRQAIASRQGTEAGAPLDLEDDDRDAVVIDQREKPAAKDKPKKTQPRKDGADSELPADDGEWHLWVQGVDKAVVDATDADAVNAIAQREEARLKAAPKEHADYLRGLIADRLTDFATEGQDA
jgi:recombination protein RecT